MSGRMRQLAALALAIGLALVPVVSASMDAAIVPGHSADPKHGTTTIGSGITPGWENAQLAERIPAKITTSWRAQPPRCPSAGNDGTVSTSTVGAITVAFDRQYQCAFLSAYRSTTGKLVWRKKFATGLGTSSVSDGTDVYFLHDDLITAYTASTGKQLWESGTGTNADVLSVGSGVLVHGEDIYDARTGKFEGRGDARFTGGTSLVVGSTIYYQAIGDVEAWSLSGKRRWAYGDAGAAQPAAVHQGVVYAQGGPGYEGLRTSTVALNASTGALRRLLPPSTSPIAFDGPVGVFTAYRPSGPTTLSAVDLTDGTTDWSWVAPEAYGAHTGLADSAPVIENGLVWTYLAALIGHPAALTAIRETSGTVASRTKTPCAIGSDPGSIGIAQHRIYVDSGCGLIAYRAA